MEERLQKIIASAGVTSRRKAEELIAQGRVSVNGHTIRELGSKADPGQDKIRVDGRPLPRGTRRVVFVLNKPAGCVSTLKDPQGRQTVVSFLRRVPERVYPIGRLDYHSSGVLLLTNDGELANHLTSRASRIPRTYHVKLQAKPEPADIATLEKGIVLDGQRTSPAKVRLLAERDKPWYEITLVEGRYHEVRRLFERIGTEVVKLKRVSFGPITDRGLATGEFRRLEPGEVERLRQWKPDKNSCP